MISYTLNRIEALIYSLHFYLCFDYEIRKYHNTAVHSIHSSIKRKISFYFARRIKMRQCDDKWSDFIMNENIEKKKPR